MKKILVTGADGFIGSHLTEMLVNKGYDVTALSYYNKPHFYGQLFPLEFEPFPKNPHIAQMFTQMGRSEELGTGIRKVYKYSKAYSGLEKIEFLEQDIFITRVPIDNHFNKERNDIIDHDNLSGGLNGGLNEIEELYHLIANNKNKNTKMLASLMDKPFRTVEKWMKKLRDNNRIEFSESKKQ